MAVDLPNWQIALYNCLGIPAAHLICSFLFTKLPHSMFDFGHEKISPYKTWIHERIFLVRKWKHHLPDAGPWLKGFAKGKLLSTDTAYLKAFITETRRGEICHLLQALLIIFIFTRLTPSPWHHIISVWAILSNLPCIINLQYTRARLIDLLEKTKSLPKT